MVFLNFILPNKYQLNIININKIKIFNCVEMTTECLLFTKNLLLQTKKNQNKILKVNTFKSKNKTLLIFIFQLTFCHQLTILLVIQDLSF